MFSFLKNLLGAKPKTECCGHCHADTPSLQLDLSDSDRAALQAIADTVVVGKITSIEAHPDPKVTKVRVTQCDLGGKTEQILCGGKNIEVGQVVPVATIGTDLGGGFVISERDIRGQVSRGMICARQEIGLEEIKMEKGGIWVLPAACEEVLGQKLNTL